MRLSFPLSFALIAPLTLSSLALVGTAGCSAEDTAEGVEIQTVFRRVDAAYINSLEPGETLVVDRLPNTSWIFDGSKGPIDYSRITIVCPGNVRMPMSAWFQTIGGAPEDGHTGQWTLAGDPKDFGTLDPEDQQLLRDHLEGILEEGFRYQGLEEFEIDGTLYWVCASDQSYACEGDSNWYPL